MPRDSHHTPPMNRSTVPLTDPHPEQRFGMPTQRAPVPAAQDPSRMLNDHTNEGYSTTQPTGQDRNAPDGLNPDITEPVPTPVATCLPSVVGTQTGNKPQSSELPLTHKVESIEAQQGFEPPLDMGPDAVSLLAVTTYGSN